MYLSLSLNKTKVLLAGFLALGITISFIFPYSTNIMPVIAPADNYTILIDPGHGSIDTGTHYNNLYEKDINLTTAQKLAQKLSQHQFEVYLTRTEDKLYHDSRAEDIKHRPQLIQEYQADLFISLHVNNYTTAQPAGSQVFYQPGSEASKQLAEEIKSELKKIRPENDRAISPGNYYVLNKASVPAVLIELGFISNSTDRKLLTDSSYQQYLAQAITQGIINYLQEQQ